MSFSITATPKFRREIKRLVKKYPSLKHEYVNLVEILVDNPKFGIPIGHDCYKIRLSISSKGKGKSGGARIITYVYTTGETVFLISIFDKSEKTNIADNELLQLLNEIE